jgi:hypothetical protein
MSISFGTKFREDKYLMAYEGDTIELHWNEVKVQVGNDLKTGIRKSNSVIMKFHAGRMAYEVTLQTNDKDLKKHWQIWKFWKQYSRVEREMALR